MNPKTAWALTAALSTIFLAACGGGGGGSSGAVDSQTSTTTSSTVPIIGSPEGAYEGTISNGRSHLTLLLENSQVYTLYGNTIGGIFYVSGLVQGLGTASGGSFSAPVAYDYAADGSVTAGSISASYRAGVSFNGTVTSGGTALTFTGSPVNVASYNYNTPANLTNITGNWSLTSIQGDAVAMNINAAGSFTATSGGCSITGSFTPRSSGKNVFNVALSFGSAPCLLAGQSASGIAVDYLLASGKREFIIAGVTNAGNRGSVFLGTR